MVSVFNAVWWENGWLVPEAVACGDEKSKPKEGSEEKVCIFTSVTLLIRSLCVVPAIYQFLALLFSPTTTSSPGPSSLYMKPSPCPIPYRNQMADFPFSRNAGAPSYNGNAGNADLFVVTAQSVCPECASDARTYTASNIILAVTKRLYVSPVVGRSTGFNSMSAERGR
jgi:hypothetical protein